MIHKNKCLSNNYCTIYNCKTIYINILIYSSFASSIYDSNDKDQRKMFIVYININYTEQMITHTVRTGSNLTESTLQPNPQVCIMCLLKVCFRSAMTDQKLTQNQPLASQSSPRADPEITTLESQNVSTWLCIYSIQVLLGFLAGIKKKMGQCLEMTTKAAFEKTQTQTYPNVKMQTSTRPEADT